MKNNTFFTLFILIIIALLIRVWNIDKPEGLWNDEYVSWYIASQNDITSFLSKVFSNCHTPLYYIYIKLWITFFPDTDVSLRISSILPSLISIPVMYKIGMILKDKNAGILCGILTVFSSFNIYFAQEVRLYSLLFLFSACTALYFIKAAKAPNKTNLILYFVFNALLCATHTLGIIFSFFNICTLIYYFQKNEADFRNKLKKIIHVIKYVLPFIIVVIILLPLLINIAFSRTLSQFWSDFSIYKIVFTFVDYLSPIQTNISNSPDTIIPYIVQNSKINYVFIFFGILPVIIGIFAIIKSVKEKNIILNLLLTSSGLFFFVLVIFSFFKRIVLSTKYTTEIYPILIIALAIGLLSLNKKNVRYIFTGLYLFLTIFFILTSPAAPQKIQRSEGHLIVAKLLENSRLKPGDKVVLTYYDIDKFERYIDKNLYDFYSVNKFNFNYVMFNNENYDETIHQGKFLYRNYFEEFPQRPIIKYSNSFFVSKMKKGERIGLVFLDTVSFLSYDNILKITANTKEYKRTPFIFLCFSTLRNNLMYSFKDSYKIDTITQSGNWTLIVYEKIE